MDTRCLDELTFLLERRMSSATARGVIDAVTKALGADFDPRSPVTSARFVDELLPRLRLFVERKQVAALESEVRELCRRWSAGDRPAAGSLTQATILEVLVRYVPKTVARSILDDVWRKHATPDLARDGADRIIGEVMESLRVFCAQEQLASLMVDLADLCVGPSKAT